MTTLVDRLAACRQRIRGAGGKVRRWGRWLVGITVLAVIGVVVLSVTIDRVTHPCNQAADVGEYSYNILEGRFNTVGLSTEEVLKRLHWWRIPYREDGSRILVPLCGTMAWGEHFW